MTTNLTKRVEEVTDLGELKKITNEIIGEVCWRASLSYGSELVLDIGAKIPYSQKSMAGQLQGAWIFGAQATSWRLLKNFETVVNSSDEIEKIKEKICLIENTTVTQFDIAFPDLALTIAFNEKYKLILTPDLNDYDLPYWELFTPKQMVLKFGAGAIWSYVSSNSLV